VAQVAVCSQINTKHGFKVGQEMFRRSSVPSKQST